MKALTKLNPFRKQEDLGVVAHWNPFRETERMLRDLDRLFENGMTRTPSEETLAPANWSPSVDVTEDEKEFVIKAELPEVKKEDVKVMVEDGALTIRGEREAEKEEKGKKFHRIERCYGSFERSFTLPEIAVPEKITSEYKDGVLTVHLPKGAEVKPAAIEIKVQ